MSSSVAAGKSAPFGGARRHELVAAAAALAAAAAAEELDAVGDDLNGLALDAVLSPTRASRAGRRSRRAGPWQVLRAALGLVAEDADAEVVRLVGPLARLVAAPAVDGDPRLQTGVPPPVWRSSGSFVRLPTSTTRLMLAAIVTPLPLPEPRSAPLPSERTPARPRPKRPADVVVHGASSAGASSAGASSAGASAGAARQRERGRASSRGAPVREPAMCRVAMCRSTASSIFRTRETSSSVGRLRVEDDEVVHALLLLRDRIGEAPAAPCVVALPGAAALLDLLAGARDDLVLARLRLLGVQHQQNFVCRHSPDPSFPWSDVGPDCQCRSGQNGTLTGQEARPE